MDASKFTSVELLDEANCIELETVLVDRIYEFNANATGYSDGQLLGGRIRDRITSQNTSDDAPNK